MFLTAGNNQPTLEHTKKLHGLDHLRTIAILLVLLFHYRMFKHPAWVDDFGIYGWTGVDLFFVLSGYLISSQLFAQIERDGWFSSKEFFIKRVFRILPAYLLVLAVYFLVPASHEREGLAPLWKYLTFTQNFGLDLAHYGTFSHAWSLCVEEQFYLLLPVTLLVLLKLKLFRKGWWLLLLLFAGGFLVRYYSYETFVAGQENSVLKWYEYLYYPTYNRMDGLLAGVSVAAVFRYKPLWKAVMVKYAGLFFLAGLLFFTGAFFFLSDQYDLTSTVFIFPVISIGFACLVVAAVSPDFFLYRFHSRISSMIAALSYAVYLSHKIVIHLMQDWLGKLGMKVNGLPVFFICIVSCFLVAWIIHLLVEKPFMRWRSKFLVGNLDGKKQMIVS
ncbi:MAG: acyltransferase [Chitinophagaceae bacterium]|nr:MAG: acyltransferase [Chitinophagaceae bacterium]